MDVGGEVQPDTTGVSASIPTPLLDRFMEVLNRFDKALQNFQAPQKAPSAPSAPSSGTKPSPDKGGSPGGPGASPVDPSQISADTPEAKAFLATVGSTEAGSYNTVVGGEEVPELTKMTFQEVYDMAYSAPKAGTYGVLPQRFGGRKINYRGYSSNAAGRYQFHPGTMMSVMSAAGLKPTDLYSPENQDKIALAHQVALGGDPNKPLDEKNYRIAGSGPAWEGMRKISYAEAKKRYDKYLTQTKGKVAGTGGPGEDVEKLEAQIRASTDKSQTMKGLAGDVSQPAVKIDQNTDVTVVPVVLGGAQASATASGSPMAAPPIMSNGGATVPFLPSTNEDNFFTMLSKVVYNIVDG